MLTKFFTCTLAQLVININHAGWCCMSKMSTDKLIRTVILNCNSCKVCTYDNEKVYDQHTLNYESTVSGIPRAFRHMVRGPTHAQSSVCPAFHTTTLHTQSEAWQAGTDSIRFCIYRARPDRLGPTLSNSI